MAKINIERERYVIVRNKGTEILCGLARSYHFVDINNLGNSAIKSYRSKGQAEGAMKMWSPSFTAGAKVIKVVERITDCESSEGSK